MSGDTAPEGHGAPEDVRAGFREALERKRSGRSGTGRPGGGPSPGRASDATAGRKATREPRRRSGG